MVHVTQLLEDNFFVFKKRRYISQKELCHIRGCPPPPPVGGTCEEPVGYDAGPGCFVWYFFGNGFTCLQSAHKGAGYPLRVTPPNISNPLAFFWPTPKYRAIFFLYIVKQGPEKCARSPPKKMRKKSQKMRSLLKKMCLGRMCFLDFPDIKTIFFRSKYKGMVKKNIIFLGPKQKSDHFEHPRGHILMGFWSTYGHILARGLTIARPSQSGLNKC